MALVSLLNTIKPKEGELGKKRGRTLAMLLTALIDYTLCRPGIQEDLDGDIQASIDVCLENNSLEF